MEALELRIPAERIALEGFLSLVACAFLVYVGLFVVGRGIQDEIALFGTLGGWVLVLILLAAFRWRGRLRLDADGVERRRSRGHLTTRLSWDEIEEIFLLGPFAFEVRGGGKSVRFPASFDGIDLARERCSRRLGGLRDRLRQRALGEGELVFRTPLPRWKGHVAYLGAVLLLTTLTGLLVTALVERMRSGFPFIFVFFGGKWLWRLRGRVSRLGTRVTVYKDGLLVRRLDGSDKLGWSDLGRTEWTEKGDLTVVLKSDRKILLPSTLSNIAILEEFIEEGRSSAV